MLRTRLAVLSEHDPDARALLSTCIRHYGIECRELSTLLECLHLCAGNCPDVLIVISDGSDSSLRTVDFLSRHHHLACTPIVVLAPRAHVHVPGAWRVLPTSADHADVMDAVFEILEKETMLVG